MLKNQKGITLVALVVTIVVLLILAAVTVSFALSETGIIREAQNARNAQEEADAKFAAEQANFEVWLSTTLNRVLDTEGGE